MSKAIRMTAYAIGAAVDFNEIDREDVFVDAPSYDALQARVDQLMWEFTPDEMTGPQKDRWAAAQIRSPASGRTE